LPRRLDRAPDESEIDQLAEITRLKTPTVVFAVDVWRYEKRLDG